MKTFYYVVINIIKIALSIFFYPLYLKTNITLDSTTNPINLKKMLMPSLTTFYKFEGNWSGTLE